MGRLSNPTDLYFAEELLEYLGEEFSELKRNSDGSWTAVERKGSEFTESTPGRALEKLLLHVRMR